MCGMTCMSAQTFYPFASRSQVATPEKGETILFLTTYTKANNCLFGVGEILEVKSR